MAGVSSRRAFPQEEANAPPSLPLDLDKPIAISVESAGVSWRGATYHLARVGQIRFSLDRDAALLTAKLHAAVMTFDEVDYEISGAVFGPADYSGWRG